MVLIMLYAGLAFSSSASTDQYICGVARTEGANGSQWITDLFLGNPNETPALLEICFYPAEGYPVYYASYHLEAFTRIEDFIHDLWSLDSSWGTLHITSDHPIFAYATTYDYSLTYYTRAAQVVQSIPADQALHAGQGGYFIYIVEHEVAYSNLGISNFGELEMSVRLEFQNDAYDVSIPPHGTLQINRVIDDLFGWYSCWGELRLTILNGTGFPYLSIREYHHYLHYAPFFPFQLPNSSIPDN
jgi:hypothetical protein